VRTCRALAGRVLDTKVRRAGHGDVLAVEPDDHRQDVPRIQPRQLRRSHAHGGGQGLHGHVRTVHVDFVLPDPAQPVLGPVRCFPPGLV